MSDECDKTWCPQCGPGVRCDEDGCCATCGATATGAGAEIARDMQERIVRLEYYVTKLQLLVSVMLGGADLEVSARAMGKHTCALREQQAATEADLRARGLLSGGQP